MQPSFGKGPTRVSFLPEKCGCKQQWKPPFGDGSAARFCPFHTQIPKPACAPYRILWPRTSLSLPSVPPSTFPSTAQRRKSNHSSETLALPYPRTTPSVTSRKWQRPLLGLATLSPTAQTPTRGSMTSDLLASPSFKPCTRCLRRQTLAIRTASA